MTTSVNTGLTEGDFHRLGVWSNGAMTDILTLIGAGGGGAVSSATSPLSIVNGVLSINLSSYSDTAAVQQLLSSYATTAGVNTLLTSYVLTSAMASYSTTVQVNAAMVTALSAYTDTTSLNSLLATKLDALTVTAPLAVSGTGTSRALSTLWKPSNITIGAGLFGFADDPLGTYSLSLTGLENRIALKLRDTLGAIRDLTSDTTGVLTFDGVAQQPAIPGYSITSGSLWQTHVPTFAYVAGGLAWTSLGTHATATFSSTHWNYYASQTTEIGRAHV